MGLEYTFKESRSVVMKRLYEAMRQKAMVECGMEAQKYARERCPVDTGLLRNSIAYAIGGMTPVPSKYDAQKPKKGQTKLEHGEYNGTAPADAEGHITLYLGTKTEYAKAVECGIGQKAQPYLAPALEQHTSKYISILKKNMVTDD